MPRDYSSRHPRPCLPAQGMPGAVVLGRRAGAAGLAGAWVAAGPASGPGRGGGCSYGPRGRLGPGGARPEAESGGQPGALCRPRPSPAPAAPCQPEGEGCWQRPRGSAAPRRAGPRGPLPGGLWRLAAVHQPPAGTALAAARCTVTHVLAAQAGVNGTCPGRVSPGQAGCCAA